MKKQIQWMYLMLALLPVGACTQDDGDVHPEEGSRVVFVMTTNDRVSTRTQTDKAGITGFTAGDEVGIFALKVEGKITTELTANSLYKSTALEDGSLVWGSMDEEKLAGATNFYAYYPYDTKNTERKNIVHTIRKDQNVEEGYNKSDLLTAVKTGVTASAGGEYVVELDFDHKLAMVQVEVTGPGVKDMPADFKLIGVQPVATVDFTQKPDNDKFVVTSGDATDVAMLNVSRQIEPGADDNRVVYRAVVPAQTLKANAPMLHFAMGGFVYDPSHSKDIKLEAGKKRTLAVKVDEKGAIIFVEDGGIADWSADNEGEVSDEAHEEGEATPLVASLPEITAEMTLPECTDGYPADGYIGWWIKGDKSTVVSALEDEKQCIKIGSGNKSCSFAYWQGECTVANALKYRLTFDYKGGKNKCVTGIAVVDRRGDKNYCFRPLNVASDAVSDKVVDGVCDAITLPYCDKWTTFSYDFDLLQSALTAGQFELHPGSRVFDNLGVIIWGGKDKKANAFIANIKFEPVSE